MFKKIESAILLGIKVTFKKDLSGFMIKMRYNNKTDLVVLPFSHLNEDKIIKYLDLMITKIISESNLD